MSDAVAIKLLIGVLLASAAIAVVGIWAKRQLKKRAPNSQALAKMTPTGMALCACFTVALTAGAAARKLAPDSVLGAFLNTEMGLLIAIALGYMAFVAATMVLHKYGHPIAESKKHRDV